MYGYCGDCEPDYGYCDEDSQQRYYIRLLDVFTSQIQDVAWDYPAVYGTDMVKFYWTEGNGVCDCNRSQEFYRARGALDVKFPCGHERMRLLGVWQNGVQIVERES